MHCLPLACLAKDGSKPAFVCMQLAEKHGRKFQPKQMKDKHEATRRAARKIVSQFRQDLAERRTVRIPSTRIRIGKTSCPSCLPWIVIGSAALQTTRAATDPLTGEPINKNDPKAVQDFADGLATWDNFSLYWQHNSKDSSLFRSAVEIGDPEMASSGVSSDAEGHRVLKVCRPDELGQHLYILYAELPLHNGTRAS